jgi:hypothetical protein
MSNVRVNKLTAVTVTIITWPWWLLVHTQSDWLKRISASKHNRSLKVTVQGPDFCGSPLCNHSLSASINITAYFWMLHGGKAWTNNNFQFKYGTKSLTFIYKDLCLPFFLGKPTQSKHLQVSNLYIPHSSPSTKNSPSLLNFISPGHEWCWMGLPVRSTLDKS